MALAAQGLLRQQQLRTQLRGLLGLVEALQACAPCNA
jgi:hypothetical protein